MPGQPQFAEQLSSKPMHSVWRYRWAAILSGVAIGWYSYAQFSSAPVFAAERWGRSVTSGVTFGVLFGLVVLLAAELPERLHGIWSWWQRLLISTLLGLTAGALLWFCYMFWFLYSPPGLEQVPTLLVGGCGIGVAFALRATLRIPAWFAILWAAVCIYLSLYLTWTNFYEYEIGFPLLYIREGDHINQYAVVIALLFAFGAYLQELVAEARRLLLPVDDGHRAL